MEKCYICCGEPMHLTLRTLVYNHNEITNVPVYTCLKCERSEIANRVKPELMKVVENLAYTASRHQKVAFQDFSEYSNLLVMVADETEEKQIEELVEDRINQLLDLLILAKSLKDQQWVDEISERLRQVI